MRLWPVLAFGAVMGCAGEQSAKLSAEPTESFPVTWTGEVSEEAKLAAEEAKLAAEEEEAKQKAQEQDEAAWAEARQSDSFEGYLAYLKASAEGAHRDEAIEMAILEADALGDEALQSQARDQLVLVAPEFLAAMPAEQAILYVGPAGMRVKDILAMREEGLADAVIRSKIATGAHRYKDFSLSELSVLKKIGMPDAIVRAMLESHAEAERAEEAEAEKDALRQEIAELRKLVEQQQSSAGDEEAAGGGETIQTKEGPMNQAACLAKRLGALKLCEKIPWPGSTACKSAAESGFPCDG